MWVVAQLLLGEALQLCIFYRILVMSFMHDCSTYCRTRLTISFVKVIHDIVIKARIYIQMM